MLPTLGLVLLTFAPVAEEKAPRYPRADLLVEAAELAKPEVLRRFRVIDARAKDRYQAGHVLGAVHVSPTIWNREFAANPDQEAWSKRIGDLGIDADTPVVVYGDTALNEVGRVWWLLRHWGVKDVRLLNGGWKGWQDAGGPVSQEEPKVAAKASKLTPQPSCLATKEQVLEAVKGKSHQIVDARSVEEHLGAAGDAKRTGAIPDARHLEWSEVIDQKTQRFKSPDELAKLLERAGIDVKKPTVTYCQSGARASVMMFTLELMGAKDVRNYYKSWGEWGNADDTPLVKPKK